MREVSVVERIPFSPERLFCPGPTPTLPEVAIFAGSQPVYHRSESFCSTFVDTTNQLARLVSSRNPPVILTCSGTGAMEASVSSLFNPNDKVLVLRGGKFGDRWVKLAERLDLEPVIFDIPWGSSPDLDQLDAALQATSSLSGVLLQANETSTGVAYPVEDICRLARERSDALIVVDGISSIGAHALRMDEWGIDAVIGGSQKGLGVPPGISFVGLSDRAIAALHTGSCFYLDLKKEQQLQQDGKTAWTPAVTLIEMTHRALDIILEMGLDHFIRHHERLGAAVRSAVVHGGLELFARSHHSNALTAICVPPGVDGRRLTSILQENYRATFAGGQDQLQGQIIRIAHLGTIDAFHVMNGLAIMECALCDLKHPMEIGTISKGYLAHYYSETSSCAERS